MFIIYLFIFGCAGFSLLRGFPLVAMSEVYCLVAEASLVAEHEL